MYLYIYSYSTTHWNRTNFLLNVGCTLIIMAPKRSLWDISFLFCFLLLFLLPHQFCPARFSEMPWSNFMKPWRNIIAMWSCAFKGWFFSKCCRCHGNGQNAKKLKNTKMTIAGYSPNRNWWNLIGTTSTSSGTR